jgi:RNA polymerase sigma-70 factor (ECF subfamily)
VQEPLLEDLFAAFRDRGDAAALAAVFDRTAGELLTLALHLAPETSAAEDLVQATFLAAIQGATTFERGRRLMPWLVGILANQAARARRDRARVVDPTRVEMRSETDPALASEQREILATLTRAIDELPDTYREAVRRHLLDGERAVDIARAEGLAPGTVRMQILRGLERLKRVVPASLLSAAPFAIETGRMTTVRAAVLSAAKSHTVLNMSLASVAGSSLWGTGPVIGGAFVTLKLCIAAIVLMLIGLVAWRTSERSTTGALPAPTATSLARAEIDATASPASPERAAAPTNAGRIESSDKSAGTSSPNGW